MADYELTPELCRAVQEKYGYSSEDIEKMLAHPKMRRYQVENPMRPWTMVAEVVESRNCAAGNRPGQKFVFHAAGDLVPEESDAVPCLWALAPLLALDHVVYDRLIDGLDPNDMWRDTVSCAGEHPECGGQCGVTLKLRLEKGKEDLTPTRPRDMPAGRAEPAAIDGETDPKKRLVEIRGMSDAEAEAVLRRPKLARYHSDPDLRRRFGDYRMVATVVRCDGCAPGNTEGRKLVFDAGGILLPIESTAVACMWALAPLLDFLHIVYDRIMEGVEPNDMLPNTVWCADCGAECGGWGRVCFEVTVEKGGGSTGR